MAKLVTPWWRRLLPWVVSAATLGYVLGYATDWRKLSDATDDANLPLYVFYTALDKLVFFLWWGVLQGAAVRRLVGPISTREVIAVRGGAELVRTVSGPLADAAFMIGVAQITRGNMAAVVTAAGVPFVCHFAILLLQATFALGLLEGGLGANLDVLAVMVIGWGTVGAVALGWRVGPLRRWLARTALGGWLRGLRLRALLPLLGWFALFAAFDVLIQGLASRAFGVAIDWWALIARIPILYFFLSLPSFANFGTREIAWAASFSEFAPRETLVAYALATNAIFMLLHVVIGVIFLPRAVALILEVRRASREGKTVRLPLLHDASDP